jgi:hypothetical protein
MLLSPFCMYPQPMLSETVCKQENQQYKRCQRIGNQGWHIAMQGWLVSSCVPEP